MAARTVLLTLLVLTAAGSVTAEPYTIIVHNYPPYYNENGQGMIADIYKAAFLEAGVDIKFQVMPVERGAALFLQNFAHAHSPGAIFFSDIDRNRIEWIDVFSVSVSFFHFLPNQAAINYRDLTSMAPYAIGIVNASPYLPLYEQNGLRVFEIESPQQMIRMAQANRIDFFETTYLTGLWMINGIAKKNASDFDAINWNQLTASLAFRKRDAESQFLKTKFAEGFSAIKANGVYMKIMECYWGSNNVPTHQLLPDMSHLGTTEFDLKVFHSAQRLPHGRIINEECDQLITW